MKVYSGEFKKIYDPSVGENEKWYINDHTIIKGEDGYHLFGITHEEPADPLNEKLCAHAFTKDILNTPMEKLPYPFASEESRGELHFWAPHVIKHENLYYMYYCGGSLEGHHNYQINLATSKDLYTWEKYENNPLFTDGVDARDPMIMRIDNKWVMYYTCNSTPEGGNHCVAVKFSDDLLNWSDKKVIFTSDKVGTFGGPCESPFVIKENGKYFLFIGPFGAYEGAYNDTAVYVSDDPFDFKKENLVGRIPSHAAEILIIDGKYYITRCGWGEGGVYLAPLYFEFE